MDNIYLVPAPIEIVFEPIGEKQELFFKEFTLMEQSDNDPVGHWLKLAKARGETKETDQLLLTLIVELHRKVDELTQKVTGHERTHLPLEFEEDIESINYEKFKLQNGSFIEGKEYYGRVIMPTFPRRDIPIFFRALNTHLAEFVKIHDYDKSEWDSYVAARERSAIREMKKDRDEY